MESSKVNFPRDTLHKAELALEGWKELLNKLVVPNLTVADFGKKIKKATEMVEKAEKLKAERSKIVRDRNECLKEVWDLTKRVKSAAKATFGDNSEEIEKIGIKSVRLRARKEEDFSF